MKTIWKVIIAVIIIIVLIVIGFIIYINTAFISKEEAQNIVIRDINQNANDIYFESTELEIGEGQYDISVYYNNTEYEYKLDAKNGRIIYTDYVNSNNQNNTQNNQGTNNQSDNQTNNQTTNQTPSITLEEAKKIAFDHAKVTEQDINLKKAHSEMDDGQMVYEFEFIYNNKEYDYKINANNGNIISFEQDGHR